MKVRTRFVHVQHCIEYIEVWITLLKRKHVIAKHLLGNLSTLTFTGSGFHIAKLHYDFVECFFSFAGSDPGIVITNHSVFAILLSVVFLDSLIEQVMIGCTHILLSVRHIFFCPGGVNVGGKEFPVVVPEVRSVGMTCLAQRKTDAVCVHILVFRSFFFSAKCADFFQHTAFLRCLKYPFRRNGYNLPNICFVKRKSVRSKQNSRSAQILGKVCDLDG